VQLVERRLPEHLPPTPPGEMLLEGQWNSATYENRLAISVDMVANLKHFSALDEMRSAAEELTRLSPQTAEL
jgi:hypothetical protein